MVHSVPREQPKTNFFFFILYSFHFHLYSYNPNVALESSVLGIINVERNNQGPRMYNMEKKCEIQMFMFKSLLTDGHHLLLNSIEALGGKFKLLQGIMESMLAEFQISIKKKESHVTMN